MTRLPPELAAQVAAWRAAGRRIAFTNGVFDILHPGHLAQLEAARAQGDVLVVGLNSDASVRLQGKGDDRPILDERARLALLEALRCVDAVALFDDPTPLALIEALTPDVLVKGADYAGREVVGREWVEAHGGRVELVPLVPGYSTSAIVAKIRGGA
jgi:D-beta-D-heptose 7-phosphate kinase/D-beta-D-heptose 1-phosphate adenosyltransferase